MATLATPRHSTRCMRCGTTLVSPEWLESAGDQATTCIWRCVVCGHEFETTDNVVEQAPSNAELYQEFLPNLLVA